MQKLNIKERKIPLCQKKEKQKCGFQIRNINAQLIPRKPWNAEDISTGKELEAIIYHHIFKLGS